MKEYQNKFFNRWTKTFRKSAFNAVLVFFIIISISLNPISVAHAETNAGVFYYVSTTGADTNPGTQSQPWKTIQKAANTMVAGDTVIVQAGSYNSQRVSVTRSGNSGTPISYQANGSVVMKGFNLQASYINIQGFEIAFTDYARWNVSTGAGIFIHGSNNLIENNYIHDSALNGITIYGTPAEPTISSNNTIRNNRLYHNEMVGVEVNGRNNLIEGNEVWGTVQCHPTLMAVEDVAADNPNHLACPFYPGVGGLDADGMRFFGQGHIFRKNYIHDIPYGPLGLNPSIGDYNDNPHIDCFQTWSGSNNEVAQYIIFEQNLCENLQSQAQNENGHGFMLDGGANNLTIRNNIIEAYGGVNTGGSVTVHHLFIDNNLFINNPSFHQFWPFGIGLQNAAYSIVKNNIFYNQPYHTITAIGDTTGQEIDYNQAFNSDGSTPDCLRVGNYVCASPAPAHDKWKVDPRFIDPGNKDFRLQLGAPGIDAGTSLPVTNDYDNNPRPEGNGFDIGAYEFVSTQDPTSTSTPVNTPLPSSTPTATSVPPTPTPTSGTTATSTPITPTATPTKTTVPPTITPTSTVRATNTPTSTPTQYGKPVRRSPKIYYVNPNKIKANQGGQITLFGSDFQDGASVIISGALCEQVQVLNSDQIICNAPTNNPRSVDVTVANLDGQACTLPDGLTYNSPGGWQIFLPFLNK